MDEATRVGKNHVFLPSCQTNRVRVKYIYIYTSRMGALRGGTEFSRDREEDWKLLEEKKKKKKSRKRSGVS